MSTDATLLHDLRRSLAARGVCPSNPTFGEWIAAVYAHGVTMTDPIDSIEFRNTTGKVYVERETQGGPVHIGESK